MASINLQILPIDGISSLEMAKAISAELFAISRPPQVRGQNDVSNYLFSWVTHPITGEAVLRANTEYVIKVHPQNNLDNLVALMPNLSEQVVAGLVALIKNSNEITFGQLLTGTENILTDEQMAADGWWPQTEE